MMFIWSWYDGSLAIPDRIQRFIRRGGLEKWAIGLRGFPWWIVGGTLRAWRVAKWIMWALAAFVFARFITGVSFRANNRIIIWGFDERQFSEAVFDILARLFRGDNQSAFSGFARVGEIRPHKIRYYVERRDPEFEARMAVVLHVYKEFVNEELMTGT